MTAGTPEDKHPTRFKPGQSGNPRGRPREVRKEVKYMDHFRKLMIENLNQPVKIMRDGEAMEVSAFEAVLQRLLHQAIHGKNNPCLRQYIELSAICMRAQEAWEKHTVEMLMNLHSDAPPSPRETVSGNTPIIFK